MKRARSLTLALSGLLALACGFSSRTAAEPPPPVFATVGLAAPVGAEPTLTAPTEFLIEPYSSPTALPASVTPTDTSTPLPTPTPFGCQTPPDDYTRVAIADGIIINQRTASMLAHAQELYGGSQPFLKVITQGSYNPGLEASFGTHDGGGAVDLSVRDPANFSRVLTGDLPVIVLALREAGFAAWVRQPDELYTGSPIHIHAIAVGDRDLSPAAQRQLTGPEGYFRGFNGLPVDPPVPDRDGAPILCPWMIALGYADLRGSP